MFQLFIMFFTVLLPLALIFYARLVAPHRLKPLYRFILGALIVIITGCVSLALPFSLKLAKNPEVYDQYHLGQILPILYYILTFICILLIWITLRDIIWAICALVRAVRQKKSQKLTESQEPQIPSESQELQTVTRREFLKRVSTVVTVSGAAILTPPAIYQAKSLRVVRNFDIRLKNFPKQANGLRIVHLSDIHVGNTIYKEDIAQIVEECNALKPDIIVITGDMADGLPEHIGSWLDPMRNFNAKFGTWFVTGNHDHMWDGKGWCKVIQNLGIHVLDNAHEFITVNGVQIAIAGAIDARGDHTFRKWQSNPELALAGIAPDTFKLMLVHQPSSVDRSFNAGADLVLLGHTHGGQCWPLTYIIHAMHKYARGLYTRPDGKAAFVSCGTGYWGPPLRFGVPPEIDVLTLYEDFQEKT